MGSVHRMLTIIEGRVLGCLLEKERTVPDQYPLTLNALLAACNQSTSREPVMHLDEPEVDAALVSLKAQGLARLVHPSHGRSVTRYRQVADESWGLDSAAAAVIAVLILRGPQTVAELRARSERLHGFESPEAVEDVLRQLALADRALLIERQPGQKEARWQQLLAEEAEPTSLQLSAAPAPVAGSMADRVARLEARLERLEAALADLLPDQPSDSVPPAG